MSDLLAEIGQRKTATKITPLHDGRVISIIHRALADGGWVGTHEDVTEKINAENAKEAQKRQLDAALNNMSQGLAMFDSSARLVICNQRYLEMYGLSREVVRPGCTLRELLDHRVATGSFSSEDPEQYRSNLLAEIGQGKLVSKLTELDNGRIIAVLNTPMADGGWVATHEDVTDKVKAEKAKEAQKRQLDAALDNMSQGLAMFDAEQRLIVCNQRYLEMHGLSREVVRPGCTLLELLDLRVASGNFFTQDTERYRSSLLAEIGQRKTVTKITLLPDGRIICIINNPTADGGWVATHEDVTDKVKAQNAEAEKTHQLDAALDNMSQGLCMFDAEQRLIVCNRRYADLYGLSDEQTKPGTTLRAILEHRIAIGHAPKDHERYRDRINEVTRNEPYQTTNRLLDGRYIFVVYRPMADGGWVATHEDVTDIKKELSRSMLK